MVQVGMFIALLQILSVTAIELAIVAAFFYFINPTE